jgi:hypothetical protein
MAQAFDGSIFDAIVLEMLFPLTSINHFILYGRFLKMQVQKRKRNFILNIVDHSTFNINI